MNQTKTVLTKDDSHFCICGQVLVQQCCPKCDPVAAVKPLTPAQAWLNKQQGSLSNAHLRSTGFGKYEYC